MNTATVRVSLELSFKGETRQLEATLDLGRQVNEGGEAPNFHQMLARASGIDPYSYLYEALESYELEFSEPTGIAAGSVHDGHLNWPQFAQDWREEQDWEQVRVIAQQSMGHSNLDQPPEIKATLLAVYRAGKSRGAR